MYKEVTYVILALVIFTLILIYRRTLHWYFYAKGKGVKVSLFELIHMNCIGQNPKGPVIALVESEIHGFNVDLKSLQIHELAGAKLETVIAGMKLAKEKGIDLSFDLASVITITQKIDLIEAVQQAKSNEDLLLILEQGND